MGYNLGKRLLDLRRQTDEELSGRWAVKRTAFLIVLSLIIARFFILPLSNLPSDNLDDSSESNSISSQEESSLKKEDDQNTNTQNIDVDPWIKDIQAVVSERVSFLESSPFILVPGA